MHTRSLPALLCTLVTAALVQGCAPDVEVVSRTQLSGSVNAAPVEASVEATIAVDQGGTSTCEFTSLPRGFNPGTFGTHT